MTTRNKGKMAAINKDNCEEHPRSNLAQIANAAIHMLYVNTHAIYTLYAAGTIGDNLGEQKPIYMGFIPTIFSSTYKFSMQD